jgi:hypothetical protein
LADIQAWSEWWGGMKSVRAVPGFPGHHIEPETPSPGDSARLVHSAHGDTDVSLH